MRFAIRSLISSMILAILSILPMSSFLITEGVAAAPTISNENVQLRTLATGEVVVNVSVTVEDSDGLDGVKVTVDHPAASRPFPLQRGLYTSPNDICTTPTPPAPIFIPLKCTLDSYSVAIGPEFIPPAQRAGDYLITVSDGVTTVSTTVTLPAGLAALPAGAPLDQIIVDTSTGLFRPTISIPAIPGATGYRISIQNDTDSTSTTFDGVAGADLSSNPSIRVGSNLLEAGKFYRFSIDAFDGITVASSNLRSESADICYYPDTGRTDIPCIIQKDVHLITEPDGTVVMQAIGRVLDSDALFCTQDPQHPQQCVPTVPVPVDVTVARGSLRPFHLSRSPLVNLDIDTPVTEQFTSARNRLDATQIPANQRAGDYVFRAQDLKDLTENVVSVTRNFPGGLVALPPGGPLTITIDPSDPLSDALTPTISIAPVPGATHYRVVVFNDTDRLRINFDNLPGGTLSESPTVPLFSDVLEPNKAYRIHMDAFNASTFSATTLRSRSQSEVYDPSDLDSDKDGIQNTIDRDRDNGFADQSGVDSDKFTNEHLGGNEFGTILNRADLDVVVVAPPSPLPGLLLGAAGGSGTALIDSPCALPTTQIQLTDRDTKILKCGSLNSEILDGTVEFLLGDDTVVIAPAGAKLRILEPSPGQYSVENSPQSFVPVTLVLKGEEVVLQPGAPTVSMIDAKIEIRPLLPNIILLGSKLPVSVAIFSRDDFNATKEINQSTLTFGRTGLEAKSKGCLKLDLNRDRKTDLLCAFSIQETGFRVGDTIGVLKAHTLAGKLVQGTDDVKIVSEFKK